jgi:hypothetical protein
MRSSAAATVLALVLCAPAAFAQGVGGPVGRALPTRAEVAVQASYDTSYLLELYMAQLASAGTPPSQADIDEAARKYFTDGASVTAVPSRGPAAAYFRDGAQVLSYEGAQQIYGSTQAATPAAAPAAMDDAGATAVESNGSEVADAAVQGAPGNSDEQPATAVATPSEPFPTTGEEAGASTAQGPSHRTLEIEAALAIARTFGTATPPGPPATPSPGAATAESPAGEAELVATDALLACPRAPTAFSRIAAALGGVLFGGLAAALWLRPRALRVVQRR